MKKIFLILITFAFIGFAHANPEVGNDGPIHFVKNINNADQEHKTYSGKCDVSVEPNGDGTAWAEVYCINRTRTLPWYNIPGIETETTVSISRFDMPGTPCEIYDSSNNAGNNQGHNITQYNSNDWFANYKSVQIEGWWITEYHQRCDNGEQQ